MMAYPNEIGAEPAAYHIRCDIEAFTNGTLMVRFRPLRYGAEMAPKANFGYAMKGFKQAFDIDFVPCYDGSKNKWVFPGDWGIPLADARATLLRAFRRENIELSIVVRHLDGPYVPDESQLT